MPRRASSPHQGPRWGLRIATGTSVLLLAAGGIGHAMVTGLSADVRRVDPFHGIDNDSRPKDDNGVNFLVVGTDRRDGLSPAQKETYKLGGAACDCTDTMLLVHLSGDRDRASVVSLPRDTYTRLPAHKDRATGKQVAERPAKLNAAYTAGGAPLTVRAVEKLTDVHVDHYLEVDFTSFMSTVDVLGGVPVCTTKPLKDRFSGLDLPKGTTKLNGGQALQYVRARHLDGGSDLNRMKRQQHFLASVISRATDTGVLMNPVRFNKVASTLLESVRADQGFGTEQMMALGQAMRGFSPASSEFASVPLADTDHRVPGLGSTVKWDRAKATRLFDALREDRPLSAPPAGPRSDGPPHVPVAPRNIAVEVANATGRQGLGARIDRELRGAGFATTGAATNAPHTDRARTTITYDPRWNRSARSLAAALPGAELVKAENRGARMRVTLGTPDQQVRRVRGPAADTKPGEAPMRGDEVDCD
ncbi:LCP family protein [Streptomyces oryzae]|uniref:LCP family protein n=1 Tax=Streptomyces oryzae TaxID=1434886 RepID=A0ABS3X4X5_9ACTN|nr:LCP family protein [Streptomyces oryzae]MBO8190427.1 LCP family protein [Streptomyces oryzae]